MKPFEILAALPSWANAAPDAILDSPAFLMPCRIGEETVSLRPAAVAPAGEGALSLSVTFGDEPHTLLFARSPRFPEIDKVWDCRADVPEPVLLALVERECGPVFQMLENAVRRQLRLVGLGAGPDAPKICLELSDGSLSFALSRSDAVAAAFGTLRNLDLAHETVRAQPLSAEIEYASFVLPEADLASLAPGDAVLLPEIDTVSPRLVVDGRFVIDANGVAPYAADALLRVRAAEGCVLTLGAVFDAVETPPPQPSAVAGAALRLVRGDATVAAGRLDRLGGQNAFLVEDAIR